ncbi:MAG: hypothetical protein [Caudoviricetes sp.]|nr:MAG: hypothetical protein [Caudoviricetes sp.]
MKIDILFNLFEDENNPLELAKNSILDMITPLRSRGVTEIPVQKAIDFLNNNPDIQGIDIDSNFIQNAIDGIDGISIMTNANGDSVLKLESLNNVSPQGSEPNEKSADKVNAAAVRAAKSDME